MRNAICLGPNVVLVAMLLAGPVSAQYTLTVTGGEFANGDQLESRVLLSNAAPAAGFRYRIIHETPALEIDTIESGTDVQLATGGAPPETEVLELFQNNSYRHQVIFGTSPILTLPSGTAWELSVATYSAEPAFLGLTSLTFLTGGLPYSARVVDASLVDQIPTLIAATINVLPKYEFHMAGEQLVESALSELRVYLDSALGDPVSGWSYGASYEVIPATSLVPLVIDNLQTGATTATIQGGGPPDFEQFLVSGTGFGFTHVVDIDALNVVSLPPGINYELLIVTLETVFPATVRFDFDDDLGVPFEIQSTGFPPQLPVGHPVILSTTLSFTRGDCNDDGAVSIADAIFALTYLFGSGDTPDCDDACDSNDDEQVSIADAIHALSYLFGGGPAPPGSSSCGPDSTFSSSSSLECGAEGSCP